MGLQQFYCPLRPCLGTEETHHWNQWSRMRNSSDLPTEHVENSWSGQHFEFRRILQQWQIPRWSQFRVTSSQMGEPYQWSVRMKDVWHLAKWQNSADDRIVKVTSWSSSSYGSSYDLSCCSLSWSWMVHHCHPLRRPCRCACPRPPLPLPQHIINHHHHRQHEWNTNMESECMKTEWSEEPGFYNTTTNRDLPGRLNDFRWRASVVRWELLLPLCSSRGFAMFLDEILRVVGEKGQTWRIWECRLLRSLWNDTLFGVWLMLGVWYSIPMTVSNTNGSTCYPWGSSLAPPCVGQGVEFPRTWDAGILDRNLKSLEMKYSWLLLSDSCLFILPISFLDSSKAAQTNNILMFLLASLIIHYTELLHLSASTFIKSTGLSNSESSNPGFFDCHLWSLGCNRFGCKKFDRDGGLAKQLVAMDLLIFDCSFLNQVYKYVRIVRILRTCLHDSRRRHL